MPAVACGIDWAEDHHDVAIVGDDGQVLASERIPDSADGLTRLLFLLAEHDAPDGLLPAAIETGRGLLVRVFAVNPFAVSRYRDRYRSSRGKSDAFDAMVLANILRTDAAAHRPLPADSQAVQAHSASRPTTRLFALAGRPGAATVITLARPDSGDASC
jgi:transposase